MIRGNLSNQSELAVKVNPIPDKPVPIPKNHENAVDPSGINVFIIPLK